MYAGKNILVTGGTGSIGKELVKKLLTYNPKTIRVFSRDESKQFFMMQELSEYNNIRYLVGDIRDKERLNFATRDIDVIFNAAALKHVPSCEYNPFEAVKTNVIGVQNVVEVAIENNVEKVVAISTDKVVNPTNTMGATKLLSEKLISAANSYRGASQTIFTGVRFGNVAGSRGSVIPLFKEKIMKNEDIPLTHEDMSRFLMSIPQAVDLVLKASEYAKGGELFVLKMPTLNIKDLAIALIKDYENKTGNTYTGKIVDIGLRPGEKLFEELMTGTELPHAYENEELYVIPPTFNANYQVDNSFTKATITEYSSESAEKLSIEQIMDLMNDYGLGF